MGVKNLKLKKIYLQIFFFSFQEKDGFELSNFYKMDIQIYDKLFSSGESAFHGMKYYILSLHSKNQERKIELEEYGKKFLKYGEFDNLEQSEIKKKGGKSGLKLNSDELKLWGHLSIDVQKKISLYKYKIVNQLEMFYKKQKVKC